MTSSVLKNVIVEAKTKLKKTNVKPTQANVVMLNQEDAPKLIYIFKTLYYKESIKDVKIFQDYLNVFTKNNVLKYGMKTKELIPFLQKEHVKEKEYEEIVAVLNSKQFKAKTVLETLFLLSDNLKCDRLLIPHLLKSSHAEQRDLILNFIYYNKGKTIRELARINYFSSFGKKTKKAEARKYLSTIMLELIKYGELETLKKIIEKKSLEYEFLKTVKYNEMNILCLMIYFEEESNLSNALKGFIELFLEKEKTNYKRKFNK